MSCCAPIRRPLRLLELSCDPSPGVADSAAVAAPNDLRLALGRVLSKRFDGKLVRGKKHELGALVSPDSTPKARSVAASRLLVGDCAFPDQEWAAIAEFVGLTPATLLREVALELESQSETKPKKRAPRKRS